MTLTQQRIIEAVSRGYSISIDGVLSGPKGVLSVRKYGKQRYPTFSTNWDKRVFGVPVHHFAAYYFYGAKAFEKGLVIRHLNGNTNDVSRDNIQLGSHSENNLDKPKDVRIRAAKQARLAQGKSPLNSKLTKEQVELVLSFYDSLGGKRAPNGSVSKLARSLGVSRTVLFRIKWKKSYANS